MLHLTLFLTGCVVFATIPITQTVVTNGGLGGLNSGAALNPFLVNQNVRFLPVPQYYPYDADRFGTRGSGFSQPIIVPSGGGGGGAGSGFGGIISLIITLAILSAILSALQNNTGGTGAGAGAAAAAAAGAMGMGMGMMMMGGGGNMGNMGRGNMGTNRGMMIGNTP